MAYGRDTLHLTANEDLDRTSLSSRLTRRVCEPHWRVLQSELFARYYHSYQIKDDEMGGTCSTLGTDKKNVLNWSLMTWKDLYL